MRSRRVLYGVLAGVLICGGGTAYALDSDGDGVDDAIDVCCATPAGVPVDAVGRPLGDLDGDCDVDLDDHALFQASFTGPRPPGPCCRTNAECGAADYCAKAPGNCDGVGQCAPRPQACPDVWDPVCGCDGMTYGNACEAAAVGVNVDYPGVCVPAACFDNADCPSAASYCAKPVGACDGIGECAPRPQACPEIWDPVCGCDGLTYSNSCFAAMAGVNVAHLGVCVPPGCVDNTECAATEYCAKADGDCSGVGQCTPRPVACPDIWDPVCGCDGLTYPNACDAAMAGVNVLHVGPCVTTGCTDNTQCPVTEYCAKAVGDCNGAGQCAPRPDVCPLFFDPVCGCDGQTYSNACFAAAAGVNIAAWGPCPRVCGGIAGIPCDPGEMCKLGIGECCCDFQGVCIPIPGACPPVWDPVCGCDGVTYGNECEAEAAGQNVAHLGPCP